MPNKKTKVTVTIDKIEALIIDGQNKIADRLDKLDGSLRSEISTLGDKVNSLDHKVNLLDNKVNSLDKKLDKVHESLKNEIKLTAYILKDELHDHLKQPAHGVV